VYLETGHRCDGVVDLFVGKKSDFYHSAVTVSVTRIMVSVRTRLRFSFSDGVDTGFPNVQ